MTGRDLLEALLKMDPADLEREVVIKYWDEEAADQNIETGVTLSLETATALELRYPGYSRYELHPIITIG
jgi:hypothetical protein